MTTTELRLAARASRECKVTGLMFSPLALATFTRTAAIVGGKHEADLAADTSGCVATALPGG